MANMEVLTDMKFQLLNHALEFNEYKETCNHVPIEDYSKLLESTLIILDSYIDSEELNDEYKIRLRKVLGVSL